MPPVAATPSLSWITLTQTVNEIKAPNQFLKRLLFGTEKYLPTDQAELSVRRGPRVMAPFVKKNGMATMVKGTTEEFATVATPNIRIAMPFTPADQLYSRRVGTNIFAQAGEIMSAMDQQRAIDLDYMNSQIVNTEEWMCAQALTGSIAYNATNDPAERDNFTVNFQKDLANSELVLGGSNLWDNAASNPSLQFLKAKRRLNDVVNLVPTDCIMSPEASEAFLYNAAVKAQLNTISGNIRAGTLTFVEQFNNDGVLFLGEYNGIRCWEYNRTATDPSGASQPMIRSKWVEFVCANPGNEWKMLYGAIADKTAFNTGAWMGRRFSKSWIEEDPSAEIVLVASRPLPLPQRPDAVYSVKVLA